MSDPRDPGDPRDLTFRRPTEADHRRIVGLVDEWWGGRRMRSLLPRLWFQHFTGTSWIAEEGDGRLVGFVVAFISQDDPTVGYVHMIAADPNRRRSGIGRALYERVFTDLSGRGVTRRQGDHLAGQPPERGIPPIRGLPRRRRSGDAEPVRHARRTPTTTATATIARSSSATSEGRRQNVSGTDRTRPVYMSTRVTPPDTATGRSPPMLRRIAAVIAATALLLVLAIPAMAGGWAEIEADGADHDTDRGHAVRSRLHGPSARADARTVGVARPSISQTRERVRPSTSSRPTTARTATSSRLQRFQHAGYWSWQVRLEDLESQHVPVRMTVLTASGATPPFDPVDGPVGGGQAKIDVTNSLTERFAPEIERLDRQDDGYRARLDNLAAQMKDVTADRDALADRVASLEGVGGLPLIAVISLSVLAGSAAGFAMAWLAGRKPPRELPDVALNPAKRRSRPGVTRSRRRRPKRPTRSGASPVSTQRAMSCSPSSYAKT